MVEVLLSAATYFYLKGKNKLSETAYVLQTGGCRAKCKYCTQSSISLADKTMLSRVKWYPVILEEVVDELSKGFKRFCLQTVIKNGFEDEIVEILSIVKTPHKALTITPVSDKYLYEYKKLGVDYLGVGLDTVERLWSEMGKPYTFREYMDFISRAVEVFGKKHVYVHLVVGLGETDAELIDLMKKLYYMGAEVALFAFTPVKGTPLENHPPPPLERYRRLQKIRFMIAHGYSGGEAAYITSGCPFCDRPYYNEEPRKTLYNIPLVELREGVHH